MKHSILVLLCAAALPAQVPAKLEPGSTPRVGVGLTQTKLSLRGAIEMALRNNPEIEIEKTNVSIARAGERGARGFLDPALRFTPLLESRNTPTGSVLAGVDGKIAEHFSSQNFYFRQRLAWQGASFHADFENGRQSTNNAFVSLNPFLTSRLVVGFSLPLLRGRETDPERTALRVRSKEADISGTAFELKVIEVVARVETSYWDVVAARQDVLVAAEAVNLAKEQVERTRRQIDSGMLAPVELPAAEAELERRRDSYLSRVGVLTEVENRLKALIANGREDSIWGDEIVPTSEKPSEVPEEARRDSHTAKEVREAVDKALGNRPELKLVGQRKESNEYAKQLADNQRKPQVNLVANYANTGLAGTLLTSENPFSASNRALYQRLNQLSAQNGLPPLSAPSFGGAVPDFLLGGYGGALSNLFSGRYPTVSAGLTFDWTPRNRAAEAGYAQTTLTERRLKLEETRLALEIEAQVRGALQAIETARQRIAAAEASTRAAQEKLDSEIRLFQTGESTNFLVLTRQNELSDSRRRVVVANLDYNKALTALELALGVTLELRQIALK